MTQDRNLTAALLIVETCWNPSSTLGYIPLRDVISGTFYCEQLLEKRSIKVTWTESSWQVSVFIYVFYQQGGCSLSEWTTHLTYWRGSAAVLKRPELNFVGSSIRLRPLRLYVSFQHPHTNFDFLCCRENGTCILFNVLAPHLSSSEAICTQKIKRNLLTRCWSWIYLEQPSKSPLKRWDSSEMSSHFRLWMWAGFSWAHAHF